MSLNAIPARIRNLSAIADVVAARGGFIVTSMTATIITTGTGTTGNGWESVRE